MLAEKREAPELLAPAGGWSQLKAAVRFGADAVYLACDRFGMRARADNFSLESMASVADYAHSNGVAVHVALNTLMGDSDLAVLPAYLEALAEASVDQLIIGDLGAFALARKHVPDLDICVSTQASVMNAAAAMQWYGLGARRIVCAREMSVSDIAAMTCHLPDDLQIEAFVHGSMCVAYSGRCLLSAAMTGRSGNKGVCAQSCRWSYALMEELRPGEYFPIEEDSRGAFILNAQDLSMIAHLDELRAAGVDSFKIEGRNKQAFYVATVVGAYRSVLDGGDVATAQAELDTISHRPYGTGFYFGEANQTVEQDGYIRPFVHVATVEDCQETADGSYLITVLCHNRFCPGDELGVVSPYCAPSTVKVGPLQWHSPADGGKPFVERGGLSLEEARCLSMLVPAEVANRSKEHYVFVADRPLRAGDYLRRADVEDAAYGEASQ